MREFPPLRRRIEYYARLAELESRLQADQGMKVAILPAPTPPSRLPSRENEEG